MNAPFNFQPGDRVKFHDRSYLPTRMPRHGTVVSMRLGPPTTVQLRMDEGTELDTLAVNVLPVRSRGIDYCCQCSRGAEAQFKVLGTTVHTCMEHASMNDKQLTMFAIAQTHPKRAPMAELPLAGTVIDHALLGLFYVTNRTETGVTGQFAYGTAHGYDKATLLRHFTRPTK